MLGHAQSWLSISLSVSPSILSSIFSRLHSIHPGMIILRLSQSRIVLKKGTCLNRDNGFFWGGAMVFYSGSGTLKKNKFASVTLDVFVLFLFPRVSHRRFL